MPSKTTLGQRFRRAIQQGDLAAAQRIAARAFELQSRSSSLLHISTPTAALRAADAQRPSSSHPFDVRNIEADAHTDSQPKHHHHHRKYTLAVHHDPHKDSRIDSDPSLIVAIKSNADVELVRWLIEMGHERQYPSVDADGNTVLHLATLYDRSDIIYAYSTYTTAHVASTLADLIDAETLHDHRTALHLACIRGVDDVARQLLDLGADVDAQDRAGNTALHFASAWGHLNLVQLLIERGCSLAIKNAEGSTAVDYAFSHSVKNALETMGRLRHESRKKNRRAPASTAAPVGARPSANNGVDDGRLRQGPSFGRNGGTRSSTTTPVRMAFADTSGDQSELYDDWDPERTFAQPGQDLFPGNRGVFSSPPIQRAASPSGRPSIDLYSEVLNHSPHGTPQAREMRALAQTPEDLHSSQKLLPQSTGDADMRRQLSPHVLGVRRSPSPGTTASADKVRMQDAAAMSLFRSATPQPSHVPGRVETPPIVRSESPFNTGSRGGRGGGGGVKSPPSEAKALPAVEEGSRNDAPPILAPIATMPRGAVDEMSDTHDSSVSDTGRQGRSIATQVGLTSTRRDSSPTTPRPDDRETFT